MAPDGEELGKPFESIESALEFVELLIQAIEEAQSEIRNQIDSAPEGGKRWQEALQLVAFKLDGLSGHMTSSRRLLNDLRTLRRLLLEER